MAQLSFADLFERRLPLAASEAVALTLAVAARCDAVPDEHEITLDSCGEVTVGTVGGSTSQDETAQLARLLHRLLRIDEADQRDRPGRVPGGLLVLLARSLRQIDLPALPRQSFIEALRRFGDEPDAATLAAIFWRAARMRPAKAARRAERRNRGPSPQELRRSLRQAEQELFMLRRTLRRPRRALLAAAAVAAAVVIGILSFESPAGSNTPMSRPASRSDQIYVDTARVAAAPARPAARDTSAVSKRKRSAPAVRQARQPSATPQRPRSVDMVNLPRATWAVTR